MGNVRMVMCTLVLLEVAASSTPAPMGLLLLPLRALLLMLLLALRALLLAESGVLRLALDCTDLVHAVAQLLLVAPLALLPVHDDAVANIIEGDLTDSWSGCCRGEARGVDLDNGVHRG